MAIPIVLVLVLVLDLQTFWLTAKNAKSSKIPGETPALPQFCPSGYRASAIGHGTRLACPTNERCNDSTIQRFTDSTIQRFNDSTIQRFNGSTVQRFNTSPL